MCLCLVLALLAGCSYSGPSHPYTLHQLQIPQLQWLPALSRIPVADGAHGGVVYGLTAFQRPGTSTPQVIVNLNDELRVIGIDGSGQHALNMGADCYSPGAVTPDARWIACVSSPNLQDGSDRLQLASLHPAGTTQVRQLQLGPEPFYSEPIWSPDGQYLAVVLSDAGVAACTADIFSTPPPHTVFARIVTLNAPPFSDQYGLCNIRDMVWSSDGQRLLVLGITGPDPFLATVPLAPLLQGAAGAAPGHVVTQDVPSDQVQTFTVDNVYADSLLLLSPQDDALLYTGWAQGEQLMSLNLHTKQVKTLFTLPDNVPNDYLIRALTWLPNGRQLLLAVGDHPCVDCGSYAISDVYVYSAEALL